MYSLIEHDSDYEWSSSRVIAVSTSLERLEEYKIQKEAWLAIERAFKQELYDVAAVCRQDEPSIIDHQDTDDFMLQLTLWAHNVVKPAFQTIYAKYGKEFPLEWDWMAEVHVRLLKNMHYEIKQDGVILI